MRPLIDFSRLQTTSGLAGIKNLGSVNTDTALNAGELTLVKLIPEASGDPSFAIRRR